MTLKEQLTSSSNDKSRPLFNFKPYLSEQKFTKKEYKSPKMMTKKIGKKAKALATTCRHTDKPAYAKGKCNYCSHKEARSKTQILCEHTDKKPFCRGLCVTCYNNLREQKN